MLGCAASKDSSGPVLTPSIYYKPTIHQADTRCASAQMRALISPAGDTLTRLCSQDYDNCLLQGSCWVEEGGEWTSYNYHSTKESVPRFTQVDVAKCPFGYGAKSICLDPYFSVAADLNIYHAGDVIYIPRLVGALLPHGETHDGYLIVRDAGGSIKGAGRFDFFTGFLDHRQPGNTLAKLGFGDPQNRFEYRMASADEKILIQKKRNYPGLTEDVRLRDPLRE